MSGGTCTETESSKVVSIDIDELCEVIDSEVEAVIKMESSSADSTPKRDIKVKMEVVSSPASSELSTGTRKRQSNAENTDVSKKVKLDPSLDKDLLNKSSSEMIQEVDIWDEDPKGLYGLCPQFLKAKGIRTPLTSWVHLSNIPCDKSVLREVMELAGNVLICHVVRTKTGYAKVKYSHPIEAAQAVSMLNGQTLVGKTLAVSIDPGPHTEFYLPVGLKAIGPGFSDSGKPIKDITRHLQRHLQGKTTPLSSSLFRSEDVKADEEMTTEVNESANKTVVAEPEPKITNETVSKITKTVSKATKESASKIVVKDKISQTDDDGNRKIIETVNEIKRKGVTGYEIIKALKALTTTSKDQSDVKKESSPSKSATKDTRGSYRRSPTREYKSSRSNSDSRKPVSRPSARSVSPRRTPSFGPRSGSSGPFRQNAPNSNHFNNCGPNTNDGPRMPMMNNSSFGPGNANFAPGPNTGAFNNFGPQGPNGPAFLQQSGPGPNNSNSGPPFGGNFGNPAGNSGPAGPFGGNSGPTGPFGGNSGPPASFGGNSGPVPFGNNSGPVPFGNNSGPVPFGNNSGPTGPVPSNPQFGGNFGAIGAPRQNMGGPGQSGNTNDLRSTSNVVILSNLPPSVSYQLLTEKMSQCGVVQCLNMTKPGTAMVRYACDWEAARCINTFDKTVVDDHKIEVRFS